MATSQGDLALITGVNGFIGYATAIKALQSGLRVRGTVRRQETIDYVRARGQSIHAFEEEGNLELVILPDLGDKHAFAQAAQDCRYIIHIASPLGNAPGDLHQYAMSSVQAMLFAAEENASVKRVVWTSSVAALLQLENYHYDSPTNIKLISGGAGTSDIPALTAETQIPEPAVVNDETLSIVRYQYAKTAATNALRDYAAAHKEDPSPLDIVVIIPGWVLGRNELAKTRAEAFAPTGSNALLSFLYQDLNFNPAIGKSLEEECWFPGAFVHLDDVAEGHVNALSVEAQSARHFRAFLMCSDGATGPVITDAIRVVKETFPDEAARLYPGANYHTLPMKMDCSSTETDLLGHEMKSYETAVKDTMRWYLTLP